MFGDGGVMVGDAAEPYAWRAIGLLLLLLGIWLGGGRVADDDVHATTLNAPAAANLRVWFSARGKGWRSGAEVPAEWGGSRVFDAWTFRLRGLELAAWDVQRGVSRWPGRHPDARVGRFASLRLGANRAGGQGRVAGDSLGYGGARRIGGLEHAGRA